MDVRDTPVQAEFTGEIRGGEDVEVRARVAGYLQSQNYDEGTVVRKGQLLFVIDPKPFERRRAGSRGRGPGLKRCTTGPRSRSTASGRWWPTTR